MNFILSALSVKPPGPAIGPAPPPTPPPWLPLIGGVTPSLYADFTTEGSTNHYWYNPTQGTNFPAYTKASFAAWLTAILGTFTRANPPASFINSSGLLAFANANVIRFDYDPIALTPKGILLEGTSTNLVLQSNAFTTTWTNGADTLTQNVTGPDGVASSAWTLAVGNNGFIAQTLTGGSSGTISVWAKFVSSGSPNPFVVIGATDAGGEAGTSFNIQTGAVGTQSWTITGAPTLTLTNATITSYPNSWFRISASWSGAALTNVRFIMASADHTINNNSASTLLSDAQVEAQSFASSYITTTSGTVTRAADSLTTTPISAWYNATTGLLFAVADSAAVTASAPGILEINDGSSANRIILLAASSAALGVVSSGGSNVFVPQTTDLGQSGYTANVAAKAAISAVANSFIYVKNAAAADVGVSGAMPVTPNSLIFGGSTGGEGGNIFGHISQVGYWPVTATAAQLQALTT